MGNALMMLRAAQLAVALLIASAAQADTLYHRFDVPAAGTWGRVSIELSPSGWHVGAPDGPPATEQQLRDALSDLGALAIGGRCTGAVDGATSYPCGFALRQVDLAGWVAPLAGSVDAELLSALPFEDGAAGFDLAVDAPAARVDVEQFIAVALPPAYLGRRDDAFGGRLTFSIRAISNALMPSRFDPAGGSVVLRRMPRLQPPGRSAALGAAPAA